MGGAVSRQVAWNWLLSVHVSRAKSGNDLLCTAASIAFRRAGTTSCEAHEGGREWGGYLAGYVWGREAGKQ